MTDNLDSTNGTRIPGAVPPAELVEHWTVVSPAVPPGADWTSLSGGRTNALWRVGSDAGSLVVKLFDADAVTPLFPNDPQAEARALDALAGTGLAPQMRAMEETPAGPSLVYEFIDGANWRAADGVAQVARALSRLHSINPPGQLPAAPGWASGLKSQTQFMLSGLDRVGSRLAAMVPEIAETLPKAAPVFLHGDPTASNVLVTRRGVTFIDWQCPARGDPTLDLAVFLSPAMQMISSNPPLSRGDEAAFLEAYGDTAVADRYRLLAPLFHWRMAAYCLWRAARGDEGYAAAAELELARITG